MNIIIEIRNVDIVLENKKILSDVSWRLQQNENWAVLGSNGSGKTTFLKLIRGDIWPTAGSRIYALEGEPQESPIGIKNHIALVSPEIQDAYTKNSWDLTVEEVIHTGFADTVWLFDKPTRQQLNIADDIIEQLGIDSLRQKQMLRISSGEAKKVLIARALVSNPEVIMLDEVCNDLDAGSRETLISMIDKIARSGTQIIYSTHRTDEMPSSITHALLLSKGSIAIQGDINSVASHNPVYQDKADASGNAVIRTKKCNAIHHKQQLAPLVEIVNADIYIEDKQILHNINWRIDRGEHWLVTGRNGAGKSTLFKLILAELHPASGGRISRFDLRDDTSVWDVRKRIGYVSSALQGGYDWDITAEEVVLSGFFASIGLYDEASEEQKEAALKWMNILRIDNLRNRRIFTLSYGESRKVLLARAMVNGPDMLLLDEPCNGLDIPSRADFLGLVEKLAQQATTIVMATHHKNEIIPSITHELAMGNGRILSKTSRHL
ncbi:MAG: ATP-binding cassette domain-containing protein [Nitrospiraceae bacterium]|nr:ATP-binding cassette domain-containing protein [Nitrospiraceae bacterium]